MVSFHQFKSLPLYRQTEYIYLAAVYLDLYRESAHVHSAIYALSDFYIEAYFKKETGKILHVRCFKSAKKLGPYLDQININEIMKLISL